MALSGCGRLPGDPGILAEAAEAAPGLPGEVVPLAAGGVGDQAVEGQLLHLADVRPQEPGIRLVPAPLQELLAVERVLLPVGLSGRHDGHPPSTTMTEN